MTYTETHYSIHDGSPAMCIGTGFLTITLINECGDMWTDPASQWSEEMPQCDPHNSVCLNEGDCHECNEYWLDFHADSLRDEYTSGADYYASYINSDSYINYLNG